MTNRKHITSSSFTVVPRPIDAPIADGVNPEYVQHLRASLLFWQTMFWCMSAVAAAAVLMLIFT